MRESAGSPKKYPFIVNPSEPETLAREMSAIDVSDDGVDIMCDKADSLAIKVPALKAPAASILKQQMLSLGGDAAISRSVLTNSSTITDVLLLGSASQFTRLIASLERQQFKLPALAEELGILIANYHKRPGVFVAREKHVDLTSRTAIMGVLNVTPDSFSDGGKFFDQKSAVDRAVQMQEQGADIIDIGAESTRPGAEPVTAEEELARLLPVIGALKGTLHAMISVDTYKSEVAEAVLDAGADIINDISGLRFDRRIARLVAERKAGIVLMHIQGTPRNMQNSPFYRDLIGEVYASLAGSLDIAVDAGVDTASIAVDPGIGFGKTCEHNLRLINSLRTFSGLGVPVLLGTSRKSFIGQILGKGVEQRVMGSAASVAIGIMRGAKIVRVHDVAHIKDVCNIADAIARAT
ncbi:MAG: dihydropteroate synthase [Candidatus Coatesbacteria bacterium]|nr:dihydropteroate synthase [Candidatus Coatesbacteria bacterium]